MSAAPLTLLERARRLRARGLSVIPVPAPQPGSAAGEPGDGKVPILPWRDFQSRHATDDELVLWFGGAPCNLAIVTGAISGVVVVDADNAAALRWCVLRLPYTPWQVQTRRGFHLYYQHRGTLVKNASKLATCDGQLAIDVRGDGGYVIGPGSVHASGVVYRACGDWARPRQDVPGFWPGWLAKPARATTTRPCAPPQTGTVDRARAYLAAVPRPEIGAGSDAAVLYAAARLTRGFGLSVADAVALLWDWAGGRPGWTVEWLQQKAENAQRYGTEPIGSLR